MCGRLRVGKKNLHFAGLVGAAMCSAFRCGSHDRWPLRGSGPGQNRAFDDAVAQVGCPDRRIDRLYITCCSPSQLHITPVIPARSRLPRKCDGISVSFTLGHQNRTSYALL
jgi:hypothetical protein